MSRFVRTTTLIAALGASLPLSGQQAVTLPARDVQVQPRLTEVFKVGKAEGAAWELYGERVEVAFDGAGNLNVFDPTNFRVVVVGPTGRLVREIGKRGEGPGEIRNAAGFAVLRDGTVAIADMGQRSFLLFGANGAYQRSVTFATGNVVALGALAADPRGTSILSSGQRMIQMTQQAPRGGGAGGPIGAGMPTGRPITRFPLAGSGGEGQQIFSAWEPPRPESQPQQLNTGRGTVMIGGMRQPRAFEPALFTAVLPNGGLVLSDSSAYALKVLGPDGTVQRRINRVIRPREVTPAMQRAERERRLDELASGGGPRIQIQMDGPGGAGAAPVAQSQINDMMRQNIEQMQFYPELPVVTGLAAGWTGKIWVGRRAAGNDANAPGPIDVLSAAGEYVGTLAQNAIKLPNAFGPDGLVAFIERDQFDVVTIAVRRLPADLR